MTSNQVTNIVVAGLGGQGVLKASDILAEAVFRAGHDVKKSEVHGMAQRGGSVHSDVRFGPRVWSPLVTPGTADFLVVLEGTQVEPTRHLLRPGGVLITPDAVDERTLPTKKSLNVALLACLARHLDVAEERFVDALHQHLKPEIVAANVALFTALRARSCPP